MQPAGHGPQCGHCHYNLAELAAAGTCVLVCIKSSRQGQPESVPTSADPVTLQACTSST